MKKREDFTNRKYGRLTVIEFSHKDKNNISYWLCQCDCGNKDLVSIASMSLKSGRTQSCGCLHKEKMKQLNKKYNSYDLSGEYGIGYTSKGEEFYFDLEDHHRIKEYCWYKKDGGYVITHLNKKIIAMHRLIMDCNDKNLDIDHANHIKQDNRKSNLRICDRSENLSNKHDYERNKSGIIGVFYNEKTDTYRVQIKKNRKSKHIGYFKDLEEATVARLKAEKKYFGEFSPQKHLFEKYGIEVMI